MSGNPFDPLTFFAALDEYGQSGDVSTADKEFRIATVDPAYNGSGNPKLQFDGETGLTLKTYPFVNNPPAPGSRVVLAPVGSSYVILGALGGGTALVPPAKGLVAIARKTTNSPLGTGQSGGLSAVRVMSMSLPVEAGRHYWIEISNLGVYADQASEMRAVLNFTVDGSDPIQTKPVLQIAQVEAPPQGRVKSLDMGVDYKPSTNHTLRLGICVHATVSPGGNWGTYGSPANPWVNYLRVMDLGPQIADSGVSF